MNDKNNTNFAQNPQGNSAGIQIYNGKATEAEKLPKQYGKMPFGITPHLTKLSAKALLLYVDMSQLFWGESNSLSLTTNPITDDGLAKRTGFSLAKTAHARRELVDSGVVEVVKTAYADTGKLKRVFRFYQVGEIGEGKPQPEQTSDSQMTNVTSESLETASSDGAPEASNSSNRTEACVQSEQHHVSKVNNTMCSKRTNPNQEKKSAKPDGDSLSATEGDKPLLHSSTSNNNYYNYYNPNDSISQVEDMLELPNSLLISSSGVYNNQTADFVAKLANLIPLGRMANRDEYKSAIAFLVSEASSYMNGSVVSIDGGRTAW